MSSSCFGHSSQQGYKFAALFIAKDLVCLQESFGTSISSYVAVMAMCSMFTDFRTDADGPGLQSFGASTLTLTLCGIVLLDAD